MRHVVSVEADVVCCREGSEVDRALRPAGLLLPDGEEAHALAAVRNEGSSGAGRVIVVARTESGFLRAAATLTQLFQVAGDSVVCAACEISDVPELPLRILGGWALARADRLREAIDLAFRFKANRVLYNWWGWTPDERITREDVRLVEYARERGIELVCELRRMSFGKDYPLASPEHRRRVVEAFLAAASAGFRSFGLLFDDVAWEAPEDECRLVSEIRESLTERIGRAPELITCPRHYWCPGQMNAKWTGAADAKETREQAEYLDAYGQGLPPDVEIYVANWWSDAPPDYASTLDAGFSSRVRRKPIFFDNQLINDYRLGVVFPFALHDRPTDFAEHTRGFLLNAPRPLAAHAPGVATALAYAWNPHARDASQALGAAMEHLYPRSVERVISGSNRLIELANEWADGEFTATNHYRTIWRAVREERVNKERIASWIETLSRTRHEWLDVERTANREPDLAMTSRAFASLALSTARLESDLRLFAAFLEARAGTLALDRFHLTAHRARERALEQVAEILPPLSGISLHVDAVTGECHDESTAPLESPAWSWAEYFYRNTRRELDALITAMLAALPSPSTIV